MNTKSMLLAGGLAGVAMGLIALPVMLRYGYSTELSAGVISAAGTLGQIIPPSVVLVVLADQLDQIHQRRLPEGWDRDIQPFEADAKGMASRASSGKVLNQVAKNIPWMLGGSADLTGSNLTRHDGHGFVVVRDGRCVTVDVAALAQHATDRQRFLLERVHGARR